jgi:phosphatidylserine decarboxylase
MVKEGIPFVVVPLFIALLSFVFHVWFAGLLFVLVAGFMAYFFRDPDRKVPDDDGVIVSAADGRVTRVEETEKGKIVSVFLSPLDVHVNRAPIGGRIKSIVYEKGKKMPATKDEASFLNERNSLLIENDKVSIKCTQIAGILARRIVCWKREGDFVKQGEKFGLIKFGSRTDLLMPNSVEVLVKVGDRVVAGETIIARIISEFKDGK